MNQDVIQVPFGGVAASKLHGLFERGYTVCGVAIQRPTQNSNFDRGAITTGGMVMWWRPEQHKSELHRLHEENQTLHEKNGLLKYALTAYEKPKEQGHGAAPAPQNLYKITGNVADVNTVLIERAELHRLQAENDGLRALASGGIDLFERYSTFKAKCEELEAMLDAVGAGGVGQSIKPQIQADTAQAPGTGIPASVPTGWKLVPVEPTDDMFIEGMEADCRGRPSIDDDNHVRSIWRAMLSSAPDAPPPPAAPQEPVAWMYEWNGRTHITTADQRPIEHAHPHFNKSKPLYTAPNPARQPLTDEQILSILTSSPPLMAGIPSTGRPCPTASACADSFSKAPTSRTPMRDGELPEISVLGSNCLMAKEEFGTVVATEGSLPPSRPSRPVRSDLGLNHEACRSIWVRVAPALDTAEAEWLHFARAIEAAHGITGGQQ